MARTLWFYIIMLLKLLAIQFAHAAPATDLGSTVPMAIMTYTDCPMPPLALPSMTTSAQPTASFLATTSVHTTSHITTAMLPRPDEGSFESTISRPNGVPMMSLNSMLHVKARWTDSIRLANTTSESLTAGSSGETTAHEHHEQRAAVKSTPTPAIFSTIELSLIPDGTWGVLDAATSSASTAHTTRHRASTKVLGRDDSQPTISESGSADSHLSDEYITATAVTSNPHLVEFSSVSILSPSDPRLVQFSTTPIPSPADPRLVRFSTTPIPIPTGPVTWRTISRSSSTIHDAQ